MAFITVTDPSDWPSSMPDLKTIDTLLRCGICYEYFDIAMIIPQCSHNYCSMCIRKYMNYKSQCPTCNTPAQAGELCNNRTLDQLVSNFKEVRPHILKLCQEEAKRNAKKREDNSSKQPAGSKEKKKSSPVVVKRSRCDTDNDFVADRKVANSETPRRKGTRRSNYPSTRVKIALHASDSPSPERSADVKPASESLPSTSGINTLHATTLNRSNEENIDPSYQPPDDASDCESDNDPVVEVPSVSSTPSTSQCASSTPTANNTTPVTRSEKLECPVCGVSVSTKHINAHLDSCLVRSEEKEARRRVPKRKPLPKLVSSVMSDKDLRKKLKEHGLNTQGNRQVITKRLHDFTLMYNAQCDSSNPPSIASIVKEFSKLEKLKSQPNPLLSEQRLKVKRSQSEEEIAKSQKDYLKSHSNQYQELIKNARERMKGKVKRQTNTSKDTALNQSATTSSDSVSESDNAKESDVSMETDKHKPELDGSTDERKQRNSTEDTAVIEAAKSDTVEGKSLDGLTRQDMVNQDKAIAFAEDKNELNESEEGHRDACMCGDEKMETLHSSKEKPVDGVTMVTRERVQSVESMDLTEDEMSPVFGRCSPRSGSSQNRENSEEIKRKDVKGDLKDQGRQSGDAESGAVSGMVPSPPSLLLLKEVDSISEGSSLMTVETSSEASSYHGDVPSPQEITCIPESPDSAEQDRPRRTRRRKRKPEVSEEDDGKGNGETRVKPRLRKRGKTSTD